MATQATVHLRLRQGLYTEQACHCRAHGALVRSLQPFEEGTSKDNYDGTDVDGSPRSMSSEAPSVPFKLRCAYTALLQNFLPLSTSRATQRIIFGIAFQADPAT